MSATPPCSRCARPMRQPGRYADWRCECCDESVACPHVGFLMRLYRRFLGRRV